jgi:hypothetical protein
LELSLVPAISMQSSNCKFTIIQTTTILKSCIS